MTTYKHNAAFSLLPTRFVPRRTKLQANTLDIIDNPLEFWGCCWSPVSARSLHFCLAPPNQLPNSFSDATGSCYISLHRANKYLNVAHVMRLPISESYGYIPLDNANGLPQQDEFASDRRVTDLLKRHIAQNRQQIVQGRFVESDYSIGDLVNLVLTVQSFMHINDNLFGIRRDLECDLCSLSSRSLLRTFLHMESEPGTGKNCKRCKHRLCPRGHFGAGLGNELRVHKAYDPDAQDRGYQQQSNTQRHVHPNVH